MSSLDQFFSQTIPKDNSLELQYPENKSFVLTQVELKNPLAPGTNAQLIAHVETLQIDQRDSQGEIPAIISDVVIARFLPGKSSSHQLKIGFSSADIAYLTAHGAEMVISGYILPLSEPLSHYSKN